MWKSAGSGKAPDVDEDLDIVASEKLDKVGDRQCGMADSPNCRGPSCGRHAPILSPGPSIGQVSAQGAVRSWRSCYFRTQGFFFVHGRTLIGPTDSSVFSKLLIFEV